MAEKQTIRIRELEPKQIFNGQDEKLQNFTNKLAKKLSKSFNINEFLSYFLEHKHDDVKDMALEAMKDGGFPDYADWEKVLWRLEGQNKVEFREWLRIGADKQYIHKSDIADKLNDFIKSDRDYKMFSEMWKELLHIKVVLLENSEEWRIRQGKVEQLGKVLEQRFDKGYIENRLVQSDFLALSFNPVIDLLEAKLKDEGFPKEANSLNTRFKVNVNLAIDFNEFANKLSVMMGEKQILDMLIEYNNERINEIYISQHTMPYLAIQVEVLDTLQEWQERNHIIFDQSNLLEVVAEAFESRFDGVMVGEMFSMGDLLYSDTNTCYQEVELALQEEGFPKEAKPENVDFDVVAEYPLDWSVVAEYYINGMNGNIEVINNTIQSSPEYFNNVIWRFPIFSQFLIFNIKLNQTIEEWNEEHPELAERSLDRKLEDLEY